MLAFLPELIERSGRIVNISSVAARLGPPGEAAYTASKAALTGFSESMQVDLGIAGHDVRVHVVNPGVIDTRLFQLPDNDPSLAPIEALPASAMVEPVLAALDAGTFEIYVPGWFADIVGGRFPDTGAFLAGSIAWAPTRSRRRSLTSPAARATRRPWESARSDGSVEEVGLLGRDDVPQGLEREPAGGVRADLPGRGLGACRRRSAPGCPPPPRGAAPGRCAPW